MTSSPSVSVVIPAYNAADTIGQAIASVLDQEYEPLEVIVVDDGSSDDTASIVTGFGDPVRLLRVAQSGVSNARNVALRAAHGELIALLDADDYWLPGKLQRQVAVMLAHPHVDMTFCGVRIGDGTADVRPPCPRSPGSDLTEVLLLRPSAVTASQSCLLVRNTAVEQTGDYDPTLTAAEDLDFLLRLSLTADYWPLDEPLVVCRPMPTSASADLDNVADCTFRVLHRFLASPATRRYRRLRNRSFGSFAIVHSGMRYQGGDLPGALVWWLRAVRWDPRHLRSIVTFPIRQLRRLVGGSNSLVRGVP